MWVLLRGTYSFSATPSVPTVSTTQFRHREGVVQSSLYEVQILVSIHMLAVGFWARYSPPLSLSFVIYKMGVIVVPISESSEANQMKSSTWGARVTTQQTLSLRVVVLWGSPCFTCGWQKPVSEFCLLQVISQRPGHLKRYSINTCHLIEKKQEHGPQ